MKLAFKEVAELIAAVGKEITVLVRGPMGSAKSSLVYYLRDNYYPEHDVMIFDCAMRSEGDVALPWLVEINGVKTTVYAASELFGLHTGRPILLVADEIGKASLAIINSLLPAILERRFGMIPFHKDSILFCTTNLSEELVGDNIPPHGHNRMMDVEMRKPRVVETTEVGRRPIEWLADYAIPRGLCAPAIAFCMEKPEIFQDYDPVNARTNPYIYKPGAVHGQFVTPRSATKLFFEHLPKRDKMSNNAFYAGMVGLVGPAMAKDFEAFLATDAELPTTEEILADPANARLPNKAVECLMLVYRLGMSVSKASIDRIAVYVWRLNGENRALFTHIVTTGTKTISLMPDMYRLGFMEDNKALRTA